MSATQVAGNAARMLGIQVSIPELRVLVLQTERTDGEWKVATSTTNLVRQRGLRPCVTEAFSPLTTRRGDEAQDEEWQKHLKWQTQKTHQGAGSSSRG